MIYSRIAVGIGILVFLLISVNSLLCKNFKMHGTWLVRAYALALGAGTQVILFLPLELIFDYPPHGRNRDILMTAAWLINLIIAELIICIQNNIQDINTN